MKYLVVFSLAIILPIAVVLNGYLTASSSLSSWPIYTASNTLADLFQSAADALTPPNQRALGLQSLYWKTTVLRALTEHDLLDAVDGKTDCASIALQLGLDADFTCRFLRAGTSIDLLTPTERENVYKLSATGEFLQRKHPESLADLYDMINSKLFLESLGAAATKSIKSGRSGVKEAFGMEIFEYFQQEGNALEGAIFDSAISQISANIVKALICDWVPPTSNATVCDIGGGKGTVIAALCKKYPDLNGILFDLPEPAERGKKHIADSGLSGRVDVVAGDFFATLPQELNACDVFYLKAIIHDWGDDDCATLLRNIKDVAKRGARIVGHDIILGIGDGRSIENKKLGSDINMMAMCSGGRERTKDEYFALFEKAGIESKPRLIKLRDHTSVVEVDL